MRITTDGKSATTRERSRLGVNQILIRDAKGMKDRITMLPASLKNGLQQQLTQTKAIHEADLGKGCGRVALPYALARKYPNVNREWGGSMYFRRPGNIGIGKRVSGVGTTYMKVVCKRHSEQRWAKLGSLNRCIATPFAIASRRTC
jgi:hypothetical protein